MTEPTWSSTVVKAAERRRKTPQRWVGNLVLLVASALFVLALGFAVSQDSQSSLQSTSGILDVIGRLSGMAGAVGMAFMVLLVIRIPALERSVGQDRLVKWHRTIGGWPIILVALHIVTITWGYAAVVHSGVIHQFLVFFFHSPDIMMATVSFGLLVLAGVTSYNKARRKLKYETWWSIHLYLYLALALSVAHQVRTGIMFLPSPHAVRVWVALWIALGALAIASRVLYPVVTNLRLGLRVVSVEETAPDVHTVIMRGRRVERLAVDGGQFFQWRFNHPGLRWESHPYSLSAMPRPPFLRVTIKSLGDQSRAIRDLAPGTRVFVEGPYGTFSRHALQSDHVTLIGAGVGVTPLVALLEDLPPRVTPTFLVRARTVDDIVHRSDIADLVKRTGGQLHEVIGSRHDVPLTPERLLELSPRIASGDVYVCGPADFTRAVVESLRALNVSPGQIHSEEFSF